MGEFLVDVAVALFAGTLIGALLGAGLSAFFSEFSWSAMGVGAAGGAFLIGGNGYYQALHEAGMRERFRDRD